MEDSYAAVITDTATGEYIVVPEGYEFSGVYEWVECTALWATTTLEDEHFVDRALEALGRVTAFTREDVETVYTPLGLRIRLTYADAVAHEALLEAAKESYVRDGLEVYGTSLRISLTGDEIASIGIDRYCVGWDLEGEAVPFGDRDALVAEVEDIWYYQHQEHQESLLNSIVEKAVGDAMVCEPFQVFEEDSEDGEGFTRAIFHVRRSEDEDDLIGTFAVKVSLADGEIYLYGPDLGVTVYDGDTAEYILTQGILDAIYAAE